MQERPILFNTEMVRAILDGLKTMTRRTAGLNEINKNPDDWRLWYGEQQGRDVICGVVRFCNTDLTPVDIKCPYGQVGDLLWVRETWAVNPTMDSLPPRDISSVAFVYYKAATKGSPLLIGKWRPSIFMPRWASRILLEITGLRAERLNCMTESDAHSEGVDSLVTFMLLWDRLNKKRGYEWTSNCWVWVITFKLCL